MSSLIYRLIKIIKWNIFLCINLSNRAIWYDHCKLFENPFKLKIKQNLKSFFVLQILTYFNFLNFYQSIWIRWNKNCFILLTWNWNTLKHIQIRFLDTGLSDFSGNPTQSELDKNQVQIYVKKNKFYFIKILKINSKTLIFWFFLNLVSLILNPYH